MRKKIHARVLLTIVLGAAFGAWIAACSGSDSQEVETPTADAAPEATSDTSRPDVQVADTSTDVQKDTGPIYDAGPANVLEAGAEYEGGIPCVVGGAPEVESNDDKASANTLAPTVCGAILLTADGGIGMNVAESDFLTFELKADTKSFFIQFAGDISMKVDVDGQTVTITPTSQPPVPFIKGKPYFIEVRSLNGKRANWRVTVFETK